MPLAKPLEDQIFDWWCRVLRALGKPQPKNDGSYPDGEIDISELEAYITPSSHNSNWEMFEELTIIVRNQAYGFFPIIVNEGVVGMGSIEEQVRRGYIGDIAHEFRIWLRIATGLRPPGLEETPEARFPPEGRAKAPYIDTRKCRTKIEHIRITEWARRCANKVIVCVLKYYDSEKQTLKRVPNLPSYSYSVSDYERMHSRYLAGKINVEVLAARVFGSPPIWPNWR
jgi:hypothetical protein